MSYFPIAKMIVKARIQKVLVKTMKIREIKVRTSQIMRKMKSKINGKIMILYDIIYFLIYLI